MRAIVAAFACLPLACYCVMPLCTAELRARAAYHATHELLPTGCDTLTLADYNFEGLVDQSIVEAAQAARQNAPEDVKKNMNGYCLFHEYTSCIVAAQQKNWWISSRTWMPGFALSMGSAQDANGYQDTKIKSAPGVFSQDAEFCVQSGWLDMPEAERKLILANFSIADDIGRDECAAIGKRAVNRISKREKDAMEWAYIYRRTLSLQNQPTKPDGTLNGPFFSEGDLNVYKTYYCAASGTTACQMHFCLANFCKLADGTIGAGCQCDKDWTLAPIPPQDLNLSLRLPYLPSLSILSILAGLLGACALMWAVVRLTRRRAGEEVNGYTPMLDVGA